MPAPRWTTPCLYPDSAGEGFRVGAISPIRYISDQICSETTAVMELGSGWSSKLFQVYLAYGTTRSRRVIYYGCEPSAEGRRCAKFIAERDENLRYRAVLYEPKTPDVSFLVLQRGRIVLFTYHSIESTDLFPPDIWEQLKAIPNPATVIRCEPVGWQNDPALIRRRLADDRAWFETVGARVRKGERPPLNDCTA